VTSAGIPFIAQCVEDGGCSSCCGFAGFPELSSFVTHLTDREDVGNLCDSERDESFTALTIVRTLIAYGPIVDPDPVGLVGGCVAYLAGR
jgi:hypothetical protein